MNGLKETVKKLILLVNGNKFKGYKEIWKELKTPKLEEPNPFRKIVPIFEILRKSSKKR